MSTPSTDTIVPVDQSLVLDDLDEKFRAFQAFRQSDSAATESILDALGAQDDVDKDIVLQLSSPAPLGHPERFAEAHALMIRSLEVLDRNGARGVRVRGRAVHPVAGAGVGSGFGARLVDHPDRGHRGGGRGGGGGGLDHPAPRRPMRTS